MALKLNSASGSITLTAEDGSGNVDISIPRAGFAATDPQLTDLAALTPSDGEFIVGDGANFVTESGVTARTSLGLGSIATQDSTSVSVTGGAIDATIIGGTTPAAVTGTTITGTSFVTSGDVNTSGLNDSSGNEVIAFDSNQFFAGVFSDKVSALGNTGTAQTINCTSGQVFTATLTDNCTFTLSSANSTSNRASSFILVLTNDGTAGRTVAFSGGTINWPGGSYSRTTDANATDIWVFFTPDGGTTWYANISMKNLS